MSSKRLGLGQFEFVDPGYGFELASSDLGFGADVFGADIGSFDLGIGDMDFSGWNLDFGGDLDFGGVTDWGMPADYGVDFNYTDWTGGAGSGNIGLDAAGSGTSWIPDFDMADVMNLVKGGLTVYQAYSQIQAQRDAAEAQLTQPTAPRVSATTAQRAPAGYTVDPRTGQLVPITRTGAAAPTAGGELIPGVPNWALLGGAALGAFFLLKK